MREPLPNGYLLAVKAGDSQIQIKIDRVLGEGGACIAYLGYMQVGISMPVVVKELYPLKIRGLEGCLGRQNVQTKDYSIVPTDENHRGILCEGFAEKKERFRRGLADTYYVFSYYETEECFIYGESNNTVYGILRHSKGTILSEYVNNRFLSLKEIVDLCSSICASIGRFHEQGFLYLDLKPENLLVTEGQKAKVIDFDTVISAAEGRREERIRSYSMGWAAPEQLDASTAVTEKTDMFAIGACFFWLITGEKVYEITDEGIINFDIIKAIQQGEFDWRRHSKQCAHADDIIINRIQKIAKGALAPVPEDREFTSCAKREPLEINDYETSRYWGEMDEALAGLGRELSKKDTNSENNPFRGSNNRFKYDYSNAAVFRGRSDELYLLQAMCESPEPFLWLGICGEGGSGKSRLAYELCMRMGKQYWQVFTPRHFKTSRTVIEDALNNPRGNILICLDYIKLDKNEIESFIQYIIENLPRSEFKTRIVLIEREERDVDIDNVNIEEYRFSGSGLKEDFNGIIRLGPMDEATIRHIVVDYIEKQNPSAVITEEELNLITDTHKSVDDQHRRPIYALFIADAWLNGENLRHWHRDDALNYLLRREEQRLKGIISDQRNGLNPCEQEDYASAIRYLYVLATYLGSIDIEEYSPKLEEKFKLTSDDRMLLRLMKEYGILTDGKTIEGLEPDLIGEFFCIRYLSGCQEEEIRQLVEMLIDRDLSTFIRYTSQIYEKDYPDIIENCTWFSPFQNIELPSKYNYVRKKLFEGCEFLKGITFSGDISIIDQGAFRKCKNLEKIILPSSLEEIKTGAFQGCENLVEVIPEDERGEKPSVISIEDYAFKDCSKLKHIIIPKSIQRIGKSVFENCVSLAEIEIPYKIRRISSMLFKNCRALQCISLRAKTVKLLNGCFWGCESLQTVKGCNSITSLDQNVFRGCSMLESLKFSEKLCISDAYGYTETDPGKDDDSEDKEAVDAFSECAGLKIIDFSLCTMKSIPTRFLHDCTSLERVLLPEGVKVIREMAFFNCGSLKNIDVKESLTTIADKAFSGCQKLEWLELPATLRTIGRYAFHNCRELTALRFKGTPYTIGDHAFIGCDKLELSGMGKLDVLKLNSFCGFSFSTFSAREFEFVKQYSNSENVIIPETVASFNESVFSKQESLKSITISAGIIRISPRAFSACRNLQVVNCNDNAIISVGKAAFSGCTSLKAVTGAIKVRTIAAGAFKNCESLESLTVSGTLETIGDRAFYGCKSLREINLINGRQLRKIGSGAFAGCETIHYPITADMFSKSRMNPLNYVLDGFVFDRVGQEELLFLKTYWHESDICIPESCVDIEKVDFAGLKGLQRITVPRSIDRIPAGVFAKCKSLTEVVLPETIKKIPDKAFYDCISLERIVFGNHEKNTIPKGIKLGKMVFSGCKALQNIVLPDDLTEITPCSFMGCRSLQKINIPECVRVIGGKAFYWCERLETVSLQGSLEEMGKCAFEGCVSLKKVDGLEKTALKILENNTFKTCKALETVSLPEGLQVIMGNAFYGCHKLEVPKSFIPDTVEYIGDAAFQDCNNITKIKMPYKISNISNHTFRNCSSLQEISMPPSLERIGENVFFQCRSLKDEGFKLPKGLCEIGKSSLAYCSSLQSVSIPDGVKELGDSLFEGCRSLIHVHIPDKIRSIPINCFKDCVSLEEINLPERLTQIRAGAFRNCRSLWAEKKLELPQSIYTLESSAFRNCEMLEAVSIPLKIKKIESSVFMNCKKLKAVDFSHMIGDVDNYAFSGCDLLETVPFNRIINRIGIEAFRDCTALHTPVFSDELGTIDSAAFRNCSNIEKLTLPAAMKAVSGASFREAKKLRKVTIPDSVTEIKRSAFRDCVELTDVDIQSAILTIESNAFLGCSKLDYISLPKDRCVETDAFDESVTTIVTREVSQDNTKKESIPTEKRNFDYIIKKRTDGIILKRFLRSRRFKGTVIIPEKIEGIPVVSIGNCCFDGFHEISEVVLPQTIRSIGGNAFSYCKSLERINIPNTVSYIGVYAFKGCYRLNKIKLSSTIEVLYEGTFFQCNGLEEIVLQNGLKTICEKAFLGCKKASICIPESVHTIEEGAFARCNPDSIICNHIPKEPLWFK